MLLQSSAMTCSHSSFQLYELDGLVGERRFEISTYKDEEELQAYMIHECQYTPTAVHLLLALRGIPVVNEKCKYKV